MKSEIDYLYLNIYFFEFEINTILWSGKYAFSTFQTVQSFPKNKGIQLMKYASELQGVPVGTARRSRAPISNEEKKKMKHMLKELEVI